MIAAEGTKIIVTATCWMKKWSTQMLLDNENFVNSYHVNISVCAWLSACHVTSKAYFWFLLLMHCTTFYINATSVIFVSISGCLRGWCFCIDIIIGFLYSCSVYLMATNTTCRKYVFETQRVSWVRGFRPLSWLQQYNCYVLNILNLVVAFNFFIFFSFSFCKLFPLVSVSVIADVMLVRRFCYNYV